MVIMFTVARRLSLITLFINISDAEKKCLQMEFPHWQAKGSILHISARKGTFNLVAMILHTRSKKGIKLFLLKSINSINH